MNDKTRYKRKWRKKHCIAKVRRKERIENAVKRTKGGHAVIEHKISL